MPKILYSPGYGPGWSSWSQGSDEYRKFMLTYQPLIDAVESGECLVPKGLRCPGLRESDERLHPALRQFMREARERFGQDFVCVGGASGMSVREVNGPFRIDEYDGREEVVEGMSDYYTL